MDETTEFRRTTRTPSRRGAATPSRDGVHRISVPLHPRLSASELIRVLLTAPEETHLNILEPVEVRSLIADVLTQHGYQVLDRSPYHPDFDRHQAARRAIRRAYGPRFIDAPDEQAVLADPLRTVTATATEPTGARARQTYYWRVRNARTRAPAESAGQKWHIQPGHPGGAYCDLGHELDPPAHHSPTLLSRSRPTGRRGDEEEFRGGCLTCDWEGPIHRGHGYGDGDNEAVEDAHDHAFPGWRTLPPITRVEDRWAVPQSRSRWAQLTSQYPARWVDQGAPILAWSRYRREAHAPPHAGRPRYELRINRPPSSRYKRSTDQKALF